MQRNSWRERTSLRSIRMAGVLLLAFFFVLLWGRAWQSALRDSSHNISTSSLIMEPEGLREKNPHSDSSHHQQALHSSEPRNTIQEEETVSSPSLSSAQRPLQQPEGSEYHTLRDWMMAHPGARFTQSNNSCVKKLYTPTYLTKLFDDMYIAVDCWHHRVVAHYQLDAPIEEWVDLIAAAGGNSPLGISNVADGGSGGPQPATMMKSFKIPHSVATNGEIVVTESSVGGSNGQDHSVVVLRRRRRRQNDDAPPLFPLEFVEEVAACENNRARRPHRVIYDEASSAFYLYLTSPAFLSKFTWNRATQHLDRVFCQSLPFMKGMYARSIVTVNDSLYMTAGPGVIWQTRMEPHRVVPVRSYSIRPLGFVKGKMNDLARIDGWWYATSTVPCAIVRFRSLDHMGRHEKLSKALGLCGSFSRKDTRCSTGTPYFVSKVEGRIVVPYIFGCSGVVSFEDRKGEVQDVTQHWGQGWVEGADDLACRTEEW